MESISPEDLKNSIIILALDNLAYTYEIALEDAKNMPEDEIDYLHFIIGYSRDLIQQLGGNLGNQPISRPKWKTKL
jgi:hypothetical protein